jgi:hypothetical protein
MVNLDIANKHVGYYRDIPKSMFVVVKDIKSYGGSDKQVVTVFLYDGIDIIAPNGCCVIRVVLVRSKFYPVKTVQAIVGTSPDKSFMILHDAQHIAV